MKEEKLLEVLDSWRASLKEQNNWNASFVRNEGYVWDDKQAYQQIKEMIQKPEVTEEWIEEKATEAYNLLYYETFNRNQVKDFIRSFVEEINERNKTKSKRKKP